MKQFALIVLTAFFAAVVYGLIQDQVFIRFCPEYFTVWHPAVVQTTNLTLLAMFWGFAATWWVGLGLGVALGLAAQSGPAPRVPAAKVVKPILGLIGFIGGLTLVVAVLAWLAKFEIPLPPPDAPSSGDPRHLGTCFAAYNASYAGAFVGGIFLCTQFWKTRHRPQVPGESRSEVG